MTDKLMRTLVVTSFFLMLVSFSSCGARGVAVTAADNGGEVALKPGETLTITLESNPTTGYSWQVMEINSTVLLQQGEPEYEQSPNSEGLVGAGGMERFRFEALAPGETTLVLGYMRPWESVQPIETYSIQVVVE